MNGGRSNQSTTDSLKFSNPTLFLGQSHKLTCLDLKSINNRKFSKWAPKVSTFGNLFQV